jgi:hypothetical protein
MPAAQPKEMPMTDPTPETLSVRIGLMIPDSLRLAGMQEILRDGSTYLVCAVASLVPAEIDALDLLVIDEVMTDHLFPLLTALQRARPRLHLLIIGADAGAAHAEQIIGAGAFWRNCSSRRGVRPAQGPAPRCASASGRMRCFDFSSTVDRIARLQRLSA